MKKNSIIGIIAVFALALFASTAMAWGLGSGRGMGYGLCYGNPPVSNLTPEQLAQPTIPGSGVGYGMGKMGGRMGRW